MITDDINKKVSFFTLFSGQVRTKLSKQKESNNKHALGTLCLKRWSLRELFFFRLPPKKTTKPQTTNP